MFHDNKATFRCSSSALCTSPPTVAILGFSVCHVPELLQTYFSVTSLYKIEEKKSVVAFMGIVCLK